MNRLLYAAIVMLTLGCSGIQVYSDYDPDIDILHYKTYAWPGRTEIESRNNPLLFNELLDMRIKKTVDQQLQKNGYHQTETEPELKVHYHILVADKTLIHFDNPGSDTYSPYWLTGRMHTYRFQEGTLIIDLMDSKTCNLIWRGWAVAVIDADQTNLTEKDIAEAVGKIFKNYPKHL